VRLQRLKLVNIQFPQTETGLRCLADGFTKICSGKGSAIPGLVAAVDSVCVQRQAAGAKKNGNLFTSSIAQAFNRKGYFATTVLAFVELVNSGYNLHETLNALKSTRDLVGMESTERASEYLRKFSKTPMQKLTIALGAVQEKMSGLQKESIRFSQSELESFGPALSDLAEEHPGCTKQAVYVKRLHDLQQLKHLSSCAKVAEALRRQMAAHTTIHAEYRDPEFLGRICVAVCKDCEKCTANRAKHEAKEADALKAIAENRRASSA
jgi:hypothetical protein